METIHTSAATSVGGRFEGRVRAEAGTFELETNPPGSGKPGTNPEELFAAGYAACFASAAGLIARQQKVDPEGMEVKAVVSLVKEDEGAFGLAAQLTLTLPKGTQEQAEAVVNAAHQVCPYSRATRGNIPVELSGVGGS